jgi:hypothetical protein
MRPSTPRVGFISGREAAEKRARIDTLTADYTDCTDTLLKELKSGDSKMKNTHVRAQKLLQEKAAAFAQGYGRAEEILKTDTLK